MQITKTSLMYTLLSKTFYETHKTIMDEGDLQMVRDAHGQQALDLFVSSGLYEEDRPDGLFVTGHSLSANFFEEMGSPVTEQELGDFIEYYMKTNEMWPMIRTRQELLDYTMKVALPVYVRGGLLRVE